MRICIVWLILAVALVLHAAPADLTAIPVTAAPKIDGKLTDAAWGEVALQHVGVLAGWRTLQGTLCPQQRIAYVCYDATNLYVGMQAFTPDIYKLKAGINANPFLGDCLEVHVKVLDGDYYQWGIDIEGMIGAGRVPSVADAAKLTGASDFGDNCWMTEVAIPWTTLKLTPKPGLRLGFNLAANMAYQGNDQWSAVTWGKSYMVKNAETILELR